MLVQHHHSQRQLHFFHSAPICGAPPTGQATCRAALSISYWSDTMQKDTLCECKRKLLVFFELTFTWGT